MLCYCICYIYNISIYIILYVTIYVYIYIINIYIVTLYSLHEGTSDTQMKTDWPGRSDLGVWWQTMMSWWPDSEEMTDEPICTRLLQMQIKAGLLWVGKTENESVYWYYLHNIQRKITNFFCPGYANYSYIEYPFRKHLLSTDHVPGTALGAVDSVDSEKVNDAFEFHK